MINSIVSAVIVNVISTLIIDSVKYIAKKIYSYFA